MSNPAGILKCSWRS